VTPITGALHACASGILTAEAAVSLLSDCGGWLHRDDFTSQFITTADDADHGAILMAAIDWPTAAAALDHSLLPCSSGERHVLKLAASIAAGTPVSLSDALTGIGGTSTEFLITAIRRASGNHHDG
jgi:hypothetical protein